METGDISWLTSLAARELLLFAAAGFLIGGLDELAVDLIWICRTTRRRWFMRHRRACAATIAPPRQPGRIAVFIPAWDEATVIGAMLRTTLSRFGDGDFRLYVGCYPNDPATTGVVAALAAQSTLLRLVVCGRPGPTTKADCLNHLWRALLADEAKDGVRAKAIVLHDAEDVVHSAELRIFDRLIERRDLIQLPVLPMLDPRSRWIAGHYADAFAEAHSKTMVVREAVGAALPSAGVGCAFSRRAMDWVAAANHGRPFDERSLTEDYELGLRIHEAGGRAAFVRLPGIGRRGTVAVREHFPGTLDAAVRQKARWMAGIALNGWDRLGWRGGLAERWMRLRDRRAPLAAVVLAAGYAALLLWGLCLALGIRPLPIGPGWRLVLAVNVAMLGWRMAARFAFVRLAYGWAEAARAMPRMIVGNIIDMIAARRAVRDYLRARRDGMVRWEKTDHHFPQLVPDE
ncbi:glycosyl transferase family protein [Sphingomonas quercus]|uniref:Glycosyl transferase family protein n=1 Tax=Sphingomonas quercus TaxID=2842451 RepID=A0ABS6BKR9_9SPHN|nr:glycosyl transferase family protein [Sphingomonas quercus]MBU3078021.1 glycosyl transferase family protein [Sphingomonas quercus]